VWLFSRLKSKQDFVPEVLDASPPTVDQWIKTNDEEAFAMTKRIMWVTDVIRNNSWSSLSRTEGLFIGGSCGSAMSGALRYLHSAAGSSIANDPEANVVVILPDGVRNYMSKPWFLDVASNQASEDLRHQIRDVLGRDLGDAGGVVKRAQQEGSHLQNGDGLETGMNGSSIVPTTAFGTLPAWLPKPAASTSCARGNSQIIALLYAYIIMSWLVVMPHKVDSRPDILLVAKDQPDLIYASSVGTLP